MPSTYSLIAAAPVAAAPPRYPLGASGPLLSCLGVTAIRLSLDEAAAISSLRLRFVGVAALDTWQSWHRAPVLPRPGALRLLDADRGHSELAVEEHRFALDRSAPAQPLVDGLLVELRFAPRRPGPQELELRLLPGAYVLAGVDALDTPCSGERWHEPQGPELASAVAAQPDLPRSGDPLAQQLRALASRQGTPGTTLEPTLQQVAQLALPYRGGALLGQVEGPVAYQLWDGGLIVRARPSADGSSSGGDRVWYRLLLGARLDDLVRSEQRLRRGYLPVAEVEQQGRAADGCTLKQTAFVDADGALRARWQLSGPGATTSLLSERACLARLVKTTNEPVLRVQELVPLTPPLPLLPSLLVDAASDRVELGGHAGTRTLQATAEGVRAELWLPLGDAPQPQPVPSFDQALRAVEDEAEAYLAAGAQLELPDARLSRLWRGLLLHNRLFVREGTVRYGLFPGVYDGGLFGVEEGWNIVALAQYGHAEEAARTLAATFFDPEFLKKEGQHHQYRNGLALTYLRDVAMLLSDDALVRRLWPTVVESADWIAAAFASTRQLVDGARPPHYGLMPRHTYGGDLKDPAYSLYGSSACWRGLRDAALLAEQLGDEHAERWREAAAQARADLHTAAERIYRSSATPPFLPFRTDETTAEPSARDYHQLFASLVLETALFGWRGRWAQHLTDYLLQTGRQVLGVARFDQWFGRLGVDAEYSRGTQLCALHRRDFDLFWLGFLGQVGLSCDPDTLVSPETAVVYFTEEEQRARLRTVAEQPCRFDSEPSPRFLHQ